MQVNKNVYLVDDDEAVCHALSVFLEGCGYRVRMFPSAEAFLEEADGTVHGVMLLDQRMTGMSGLELQDEIVRRDINLSIIFITGHGDVKMSVKAIKFGAIDFLEKPFSNEHLLASLKEAFSRVESDIKHRKRMAELRERHDNLTAREQEIMQHVVAGMTNKDTAELLGVTIRTIEVHRAKAMKKMGAETLPDLVRKHTLYQQAGR
jgi:RNA polymerase sigma factor (sigma-70 family)